MNHEAVKCPCGKEHPMRACRKCGKTYIAAVGEGYVMAICGDCYEAEAKRLSDLMPTIEE